MGTFLRHSVVLYNIIRCALYYTLYTTLVNVDVLSVIDNFEKLFLIAKMLLLIVILFIN